MKKVFYDSWVAKFFLMSGYNTITLGPFVYTKRKVLSQAVINHECTHARQWCECAVLSGFVAWVLAVALGISAWWMLLSGVAFYIWYGIEYLVRRWGMAQKEAYRAVRFEQEARRAEQDDNYLENSHYFGWL